MLKRHLFNNVVQHLRTFPAVAILGCRQVGKTTLAHQVQNALGRPSLYFDLELPDDRARFSDPQLMLEQHMDKLLILDEIQRVPELFAVMRGIIDRRRRNGDKSGHYLILGSASPNLLRQSSESLAGRIAYLELNPFSLEETEDADINNALNRLWLRGGFPDSFLAPDDEESLRWRKQFIATYLERDLPQLSRQFPAERIYGLWKMLAYDQGTLLNVSRLSKSLEISAGSIRDYIGVMTDLFLLRRLLPWHGNTRKRLVKAPRIYVRDSGLVHALTGLKTLDDITGHSLCGLSWEGFAIEQIVRKIPFGGEAFFYRSSAGEEIDLVLEMPGGNTMAIEIKRTSSPKLTGGFAGACEEIKAKRRFYVIPEGESYPLDKQTTAVGLRGFLRLLPDNI